MSGALQAAIPTAGRARSDAPGRRAARAGCLAIAAAVLPVLLFASPEWSAALQYDRAAVASGEVWRVVTCHWTHWSGDHLRYDAAALAVLAFACATQSARRFAWTIGIASLAIPAAVCLAHPELATYRGLSGLASALMVLTTVDGIRDARGNAGRRRETLAYAALLAAFAGKLAYELVTGEVLFVDTESAGFVPVPLAHAVGAAAGAIVAWAPRPCIPDPHGRGARATAV